MQRQEFAMQRPALEVADPAKRARVDTVHTILKQKGHDIRSIAPDVSVFEAITAMAFHGIGALLVLADRRLVGIISERDYARKVILQGRSSRETRVVEIMTPSPITVTSNHTVDDCLRIVTERCIRYLPVVDQGELRGIVSSGDLIKAIVASQTYTIDQLHGYIATEYPS